MKVALDPARYVGTTRIAAISLTSSGARECGAATLLSGGKRPLALLVLDSSSVAAFAATGQRLSLAEIEQLCPGALAVFLAEGT